MGIDAGIYSQVGQGVPVMDPVGAITKGLQLKQLKQSVQDDQTMRDLSQQAGGNLGTLADLAQGKGLYKQAMDLRQKQIAQQKEVATIQETLGKVDAQRRAAIQAGNEDVGKMAAWADTPEKWQQGLQVVLRDHPVLAQGLQPFMQFSPENRKAVLTRAQSVQAALDGLKPKVEERNGVMVPVTTDVLGQQTVGAPVAVKAQSDVAKINQDEKNGAVTPAQAEQERRKATNIPVPLAQQLAAVLGPPTQGDIRRKADLLKAGQAGWPTGQVMRADPSWGAAMKLAISEDPSLNESTHKTREKMWNDWNSGKLGSSNNAINTAIAHLGHLVNLYQEIPDMGLESANRVANFAKKQGPGGNPAFDEAQTVINAVGDELEKAYAGTGTEGGRHSWKDKLDPNLPMQTRMRNALALIDLLHGKIKANTSQFKRGVGNVSVEAPEVLTPESQATLDAIQGWAKKGGTGGHASPQASAASPATPPAAGGTKVMSWADAKATAQATGKTAAEVVEAAKKQGWKVVD